MKKLLPLVIIAIIVLSGIQAIAFNHYTNKNIINKKISNNKNTNTHTIFVEVATWQWCPSCSDWNTNIYDLYNTDEYNFEFVEMIIRDFENEILNDKARDWALLYDIFKHPTSIIDGDYRRISGNYLDIFKEKLDECSLRNVKNISAEMNVEWLGNATVKVNVSIQNNEATQYNGYIRVPITEIQSRYYTYGGTLFHYGFLDYAFDEEISVSPGGIFTDNIIWDGNDHKDNHNENFSDIKPENIKMIMGVFNKENNFCDETISAPKNLKPDIPTINGPKEVNKGILYKYNFTTTDPDDDNVSYQIDWGDGDITPWSDYKASGETFTSSHIWDSKGNYIIKVKAKDIYFFESDYGELEIKVPKYKLKTSKFLLNFLTYQINFLLKK